jgi:hypothetical protein
MDSQPSNNNDKENVKPHVNVPEVDVQPKIYTIESKLLAKINCHYANIY